MTERWPRDDREMKKAIFRPKMLFFVFRRLIADILTLAPSLFFVLRRLIADTYPLFSLDFASKLRIIYVFFVKICLIKNFLLSLHPIWVHKTQGRAGSVLISGIYLRRDNLPGGAQKIVGERVLYILKGVYWRFVIDKQKASNTFLQFQSETK